MISPIFYMGSKKKLIKSGLTELFPSNINCFVDLFAGSGIVSMNVNSKKYILNDINIYLHKLYTVFRNNNAEEIVNHIKRRIEEFSLAKERTSHKTFNDDRKQKYKKSYYDFREFYNKKQNPLDLYTLSFYSFSQQIRFNKYGEFNMPCGNDCFSENNIEYIKNGCTFFHNDNVFTSKFDFRSIPLESITDKDFVYLDPPYFISTATYNENAAWTYDDENDLLKFCEKLSNKNIKFGMSNVFENKGIINTNLIDWCERNNLNVYKFDKHSYSACGKGNSNAKEVFITNY